MKYNIPYFLKFKAYCLSLAILIVAAGCQAQSQQPDPNRAYFEIHPLYKTMIVPVTINDTVTARMGFDTGYNFNLLDMDSTFCAAHPLQLWQGKPDTVYSHGGGSGWVYDQPKGDMLLYDKNTTVRFGQTDVNYKWTKVWNQKGYYGENGQDGFFNMPADTAHVWELNFEHNYIELHPSDIFTVPESSISVPIYISKTNGRMYATIPMKITTSDGDTLTINRDFMVDAGMGQDVILVAPAEELSFFEGKKAVPFYFGDGYIDRHIVDATVFDGFPIDSLRIYTLEDRARLSSNYYIGINFLKRFNVFIDLRNMRMYLQPLKEFHRAFSPLWKRFDLNVSPTEKGSYLVTEVADHALNPYKKAGVLVGDEIVAIGGITLAPDTSLEERKKLLETQKVIFDIIRNGKHITITMERDPDDIQGD